MTRVPRRTRGSSTDTDTVTEDAPIRSRRTRTTEPEEAPRRARTSRRSGASEEAPARERTASRSRAGAGGWGAYESKRQETTSQFATEFKPEANKETVIKVLDKGPYTVYLRHWINTPDGIRKSYLCLKTFDDECPLCEIGDPTSTFSLFNVLNLANPEKPSVEVWNASVTVTDQLERLAKSPRTSPLDRDDLYFVVTPVKKGRKTITSVDAIDADKLDEYYEIEPFTAEELEEYLDDRHEEISAVISEDSADDLDALIEKYNL